jgi:hypothetical protein
MMNMWRIGKKRGEKQLRAQQTIRRGEVGTRGVRTSRGGQPGTRGQAGTRGVRTRGGQVQTSGRRVKDRLFI